VVEKKEEVVVTEHGTKQISYKKQWDERRDGLHALFVVDAVETSSNDSRTKPPPLLLGEIHFNPTA